VQSFYDRHVDQTLLAGRLRLPVPKNAIRKVPQLWRELVVNRIVLRLRASTDTGDLLHSDRILIGGFEAYTPFRSDDINVSAV
jgi:hypothetical protein